VSRASAATRAAAVQEDDVADGACCLRIAVSIAALCSALPPRRGGEGEFRPSPGVDGVLLVSPFFSS
jgi:hypothetical protein